MLRSHGDVVVETPGMPTELSDAVFPGTINISALTSTSGTRRHLSDGDVYRLITVWMDSPLGGPNHWHLQVALDVCAHKRIMASYRLQPGGILMAGLLVSAAVVALVAFFYAFLSVCQWQSVYYTWRPNLSDEADNHLVELAVAGQAGIIVTRNVKDFVRAELHFSGLRILEPDTLIEETSQDGDSNDSLA